ncbi:MAG: nicotinate (nicotinamide) nucleotide adenylyltransferase [Lachnospiraceae bacterium]|nr:nicotinate (nicotinamide) nucleotide adenylyltransferase [Lachnospiraceae bacterium]
MTDKILNVEKNDKGQADPAWPNEGNQDSGQPALVCIPYAEKDSAKKRIIVMGGSFNPPTLAHFRLMMAAVEAVGAEKGIFTPSNHTYVSNKMRRQKRQEEVLSEQTRLDMLKAMCAEDARLGVDTCEYGRDSRAKTYETMETIQEKYPDAELYFVVGGDKLSIIPRWHRKNEFLQRFKLLVVKRDGTSPEDMIAGNPFLTRYADAFVLLREPDGLEGISSTSVRDLLRDGNENGAKQVHPKVWKLLLEEGWLKMDITSFRGDYHFLSNFYEAPVEYGGLIYGNNEAAFQAQKCRTEEERKAFTELRPSKAKRAGRQVQLRPDWEKVKVGLMEEIVRAKFAQNPDLAGRLLATGDRKLVEGNTWGDTCWGVDSRTGQGENHFGRILMKIRDELRD